MNARKERLRNKIVKKLKKNNGSTETAQTIILKVNGSDIIIKIVYMLY